MSKPVLTDLYLPANFFEIKLQQSCSKHCERPYFTVSC